MVKKIEKKNENSIYEKNFRPLKCLHFYVYQGSRMLKVYERHKYWR